MTIRVTIDSEVGFDTKYLFPGLLTGSGAGAAFDDEAVFSFARYRNGAIVDDDQPLSRVGYLIVGLDLVDEPADVSGRFFYWKVYDQINSPNDLLAEVSFDGTNNRYAQALSSFAMLTPDTLLGAQLDDDSAADILVLEGNKGNDTLRGSDWGDSLDGGAGKDLMIGGGGNDSYVVDNKGDRISDSSGHDYVIATAGFTLPKGIEDLYGDGFDDFALTGNSGGNYILGSFGDNTLKGLDGKDSLEGGVGRDVLTGGKGDDNFYFAEPMGSSERDTITDFSPGHDRIWLNAGAFDLPFGFDSAHEVLAKSAFYASKSGKAHDKNDRILYDTDDGKLYYDEDGTGGANRMQLADLSGHPTLHASDFVAYFM